MKTVLILYVTAILLLIGGIIYINHSLVNIQHEEASAYQEYTPLVVQQSNAQIMPTEAYQGGTGYGVEEAQTATVNIQ